MPRVEVTAKAGCIYDSVPRPVGEKFDCDLGHARMLRLIGKVEFADSDIPEPEPAPATPTRQNRRYRRRDLQAEG